MMMMMMMNTLTVLSGGDISCFNCGWTSSSGLKSPPFLGQHVALLSPTQSDKLCLEVTG